MDAFKGKCVIVTGAASGFGTAIAERFAREGASLVVADLNSERCGSGRIRLPSAIAFEIDVADEEQNRAMAAAAVAAFGGIDVVCANAGVPHRAKSMIRMETADFDRMFAVNVRSIFLAAKYCVPHMVPGSSIISTASIGGKRPRHGLTPYNASKGAVITLTRGLAIELAPKIRVNAVCPGLRPHQLRSAGHGHTGAERGAERLGDRRHSHGSSGACRKMWRTRSISSHRTRPPSSPVYASTWTAGVRFPEQSTIPVSPCRVIAYPPARNVLLRCSRLQRVADCRPARRPSVRCLPLPRSLRGSFTRLVPGNGRDVVTLCEQPGERQLPARAASVWRRFHRRPRPSRDCARDCRPENAAWSRACRLLRQWHRHP